MQGKELEERIEEVERRWLPDLKNYIREEFGRVFLPSHDHLHHWRVWKTGREILIHISVFNNTIDQDLAEGVLMACMFHDLGMIRTMDREHGRISREMFEAYITGRGSTPPRLMDEIAEAIEIHDRKGEHIFPEIPVEDKPSVATILSLADDLDAMGTNGIYRYAEIYLHRDMPLEKLGIEVLANLSSRYATLAKICFTCPALLNQHRQQYSEVISFYDKYNQQILSDPNPRTAISGHIGVINLIRQLSIEKKIPPADFARHCNPEQNGRILINYFNQLAKLYEEYNQDFDRPNPH
ncbi:MAG: HD domain-containing protein [Bacteroidota bacterium]